MKNQIFLSLAFFQLTFSQQLELPLKWETNQKVFLESAPIAADINNDGYDETIIAGHEELVVLGKQGKELWQWRTDGRLMTYPSVLIQENKSVLIFVGDKSGYLHCLNGTGELMWKTKLNAGVEWCANVLSDLNNDGKIEVIQGDQSGVIWILDALTGNVNHHTTLDATPVSPSVGDLNNDGLMEIVFSTNDGVVTAMNHKTATLWNYKIGEASSSWSTSSPVMFSASDGKTYIIVASADGVVYCLDKNGNPIWDYPTNSPIASSISIGDFNLNGRADIFAITQKGVIYRFDEKGSVIWKIDMQGRTLAPGAILDINNDGEMEFILSTQRGHILAFSNDGKIIFDHQLPSRSINNTPAFGNISGSVDDLEFALTGGEAGMAYCFGTPASNKTIRHWSSYRGDIRNTGSWFGLKQSNQLRMVPQNLEWDRLFVGEPVIFNVINPYPTTTSLSANGICIGPNGTQYTATSTIIGKKGQLLLPIEIAQPGDYSFTWELIDGNEKILFSDSKEIAVIPFHNDRSLIQQAIGILASTADECEKNIPLTANALRHKALLLQSQFDKIQILQNSVPGNSASAHQKIFEQTSSLNRKAKRAFQISTVCEKATQLGDGTSLIAFEGTHWQSKDVHLQLPERVVNPVEINRRTVLNEHEPVSLMLFNITDQLLNVRVHTENTKDGISVTLLRSVNTITSIGEESWDAMPELDESNIVTIPSLTAREVWLDIVTENSPGKYKIDLILQALNGDGVVNASSAPQAASPPETHVEIMMEVFLFTMSPPEDFRLCTWSPSIGPEISDLLAHGNNVFRIPHGKITYNRYDKIKNFDFSELDKITNQFKEHNVFLLIGGFPAIKGEFGSAKYKKDLSKYMKSLKRHLKNSGYDTNQFAIYPIDEPGGHGWNAVNKLVQFGEIVHENHPDIMLYQDGGGELPMFNAMGTVIDVWVPPFDWLSEDSPEMDVMQNVGDHLWSYNCTYTSSRPIGPNIKNINLMYEFRTAALMALRSGASGIGYWCYNANSENPWGRIKFEYNLVYPGRTKPVTSRRWEAVREGIEDYRILSALKNIAAENQNLNSGLQEKINQLLESGLIDLVDPGYQAMKLGVSRENFDLVSNELNMVKFRNEMLDCIEEITEGKVK